MSIVRVMIGVGIGILLMWNIGLNILLRDMSDQICEIYKRKPLPTIHLNRGTVYSGVSEVVIVGD